MLPTCCLKCQGLTERCEAFYSFCSFQILLIATQGLRRVFMVLGEELGYSVATSSFHWTKVTWVFTHFSIALLCSCVCLCVFLCVLKTRNTVCFIHALCLLVLSPKYILILATPYNLLRLSTCHFSPGWLYQPLLPPCSLAQGSASFSAKDQVVNLLGSVDHTVPVAMTEHLIKSALVAPAQP